MSRPVTIKDLSRETGLSLGTISKYLNGIKIKPANEERLVQAINDMDYKVNLTARGLKTKKSMLIGVLIPNIRDTFYTDIIYRIEQKLANFGYNIMLCDYGIDKRKFEDKIDMLISKNMDAIIAVPEENSAEVIRNAQRRTPIIFFDCQVVGVECDAVMTDSFDSTFKATEYLINNGHKRIQIILGRDDSSTSIERMNGYLKAHELHNVPVDKSLICFGNYTLQGGYDQTIKMIENKVDCTAIFATNYYMTMGSVIALNEKNKIIPDDYSFVGFDQIEMAALCKPPLLMVEQPMADISNKITEIVLKRLKGDKSDFPIIEKLPSNLKVTDSVRNISNR